MDAGPMDPSELKETIPIVCSYEAFCTNETKNPTGFKANFCTHWPPLSFLASTPPVLLLVYLTPLKTACVFLLPLRLPQPCGLPKGPVHRLSACPILLAGPEQDVTERTTRKNVETELSPKRELK